MSNIISPSLRSPDTQSTIEYSTALHHEVVLNSVLLQMIEEIDKDIEVILGNSWCRHYLELCNLILLE